MTPKEALETIKHWYSVEQVNTLKKYQWKEIKELLPNECKIVETALNRLEELEKVLSFIKEHTLLDSRGVLKADFQWDLDCEENGELLKEYLK